MLGGMPKRLIINYWTESEREFKEIISHRRSCSCGFMLSQLARSIEFHKRILYNVSKNREIKNSANQGVPR